MIRIQTKDELNGTLLTIEGHAEKQPDNGIDFLRACAAVSLQGVMLARTFDGRWDGDGSGFVEVLIPRQYQGIADFALAGLLLLAQNYPEYVVFIREDSHSFREESPWNNKLEWQLPKHLGPKAPAP